jgi:putative endonuclease
LADQEHRARQRRKHAQRRGKWAERWACLWLFVKGYRILGRNLKTPYGEIDIFARQGRQLVVIEVKNRQNWQDGLYALQKPQQKRLERASLYLQSHQKIFGYQKNLTNLQIRFDVIVIAQGRLPMHLIDAWQEN